MNNAEPRSLSVFFDAAGFNKYNPDDLCVLLGIPDKDWEEIMKDPSKLITVMQDALIAAIRGVAKPGDDLKEWISNSCEEMKKRVSRSSNDLAKLVPLSTLNTKEETQH